MRYYLLFYNFLTERQLDDVNKLSFVVYCSRWGHPYFARISTNENNQQGPIRSPSSYQSLDRALLALFPTFNFQRPQPTNPARRATKRLM